MKHYTPEALAQAESFPLKTRVYIYKYIESGELEAFEVISGNGRKAYIISQEAVDKFVDWYNKKYTI